MHLRRILLIVVLGVLGLPGAAGAQVASPTVQSFAAPTLTTVGVPLRDQATIVGGNAPTGTVTFQLFADGACSVPVFTSTTAVGSFPTATSDPYVTSAPGTYRWVARYNGDANNNPSAPTACDDPFETVVVNPGGAYVALTPARIEDTRTGAGGLAGPLGPGATAAVQVTGRGGVPATGVSAVVMNATVTQPTGQGYLTLYPGGSEQPVASNLNFTVGKTVPNLVAVKVGPDGRVNIFNSAGTTHIILDVVGYATDAPRGTAGRYDALDTARIADSRFNLGDAVRLGPGQSVDVTVAGRLGVPANAEAVVLNVAATQTTAASYLTIHPSGEPRPLASNLNWSPGDTVSNRVMTKVGGNGKVTIYNDSGATDIVIDLNGYYTDASSEGVVGMFTPREPVRILDTRTGLGGLGGPIAAGATVDVQVTGRGGLPAKDIRAAILNVTVTSAAAPGYLTIYRSGGMQRTTSDLNYAAGETRPNLVVARLGGNDGRIRVFSSATTHVIVDVAGYFS